MIKKTRAQNAVSEIVSTVLLLGITISLFAILNFIVFSFSFGSSPPSVSLIGTLDITNNTIIIEHYNGDSLSATTDIVITVGDSTYQKSAGELLNDHNRDNEWNFGETVQFHPLEDLTNKYIQVTVVDPGTNTIILTSVLQRGI